MKYILSVLFGGLAIFFLFKGVIPAINGGDYTGAFGFALLCVGAILVANGMRAQISSDKKK